MTDPEKHRAHVPQRCRQCGGARHRERHDITTYDSWAATGKRSYIPGLWDECASCGSREEPEPIET